MGFSPKLSKLYLIGIWSQIHISCAKKVNIERRKFGSCFLLVVYDPSASSLPPEQCEPDEMVLNLLSFKKVN